jgi:hypothetical protein
MSTLEYVPSNKEAKHYLNILYPSRGNRVKSLLLSLLEYPLVVFLMVLVFVSKGLKFWVSRTSVNESRD